MPFPYAQRFELISIIGYVDERYLFAMYYFAFFCIPFYDAAFTILATEGNSRVPTSTPDSNIKLLERPTVIQSLTSH